MTVELRGRALLDWLNSRAGLAWTESSDTLLIAAIMLMFKLTGQYDLRVAVVVVS